jgi:pilus assembly protein CpaB
MRPIQIVILLVALVAAGSAGMIAMKIARKPVPVGVTEQAAVQQMPTEEVLVASADFTVGKAVGEGGFIWKPWPTDALSPGVITRRDRPEADTELAGTLVKSPIFAGEPVRESKLVRSDRGFLSAVLPKGMRAVAVKVNAAATAGGFILPNDRVDVLMIREAAGGARSETILNNVRVLAIDQSIESEEGDQKSVMVAQDTATLELTPDQAELITQAQQMGTIALVLRSIEDSAPDTITISKPTGVSVVKFGIPSRVNAREAQ